MSLFFIRIFINLIIKFDGAQHIDKSNYSQFSPKKMPMTNLFKNYAALYFMIHFSDFFYVDSVVMGYLKQKTVNLFF